jgi:hypothetical protein
MSSITILQLQEDLRSLGFGPNLVLDEIFLENISGCRSLFDLSTELGFEDESILQVKLFFRKAPDKEAYFLEKYQATLHFFDDPEKDKTHVFYMTKDMRVTSREAFNLLQGRAVFKELAPADGENYTAWIKLNFGEKKLDGNYRIVKFRTYSGYDFSGILNRYPIRELGDRDLKAGLIRALKRGDLQMVTFLKPSGKIEKKLIEANPQLQTINIYSVRKTVPKQK